MTMAVPKGIVPSLLLPEIYAPWKAEPGFLVAQIERAGREGFYRSVEIGPIAEAADRSAIKRVCEEHDLQVAAWLTQILDEEKFDLTAIDEATRRRSVEGIKRSLPAAIACGATTVALVGGPDPGPALRERGYDSFVNSMTEICVEAGNLGAAVMFEPLDRFAHKKRLIGPTEEIVQAFARVRANCPTFGLAFDTAHAALNEEDISASLALAGEQVVNLHLSNAVLDRNDPLYGDHHMMPGAPGFLTVDRAAAIITEVVRLGIRDVRAAVEAKAKPEDHRQITAETAERFLKAAFEQAERLLKA